MGVETQAAGVPMLVSDKVSPEVVMSKCVTLLPIDSTKRWVDGILLERNFRRIKDAPMDVANAGYDTQVTAKRMTEFYEQHWN